VSLNSIVVRKQEKLLDDFVEFGRLQLESGDIDPAYPVLQRLQRGLEPEAALWHTLVYVAYYNLDSGLTAVEREPTWRPLRSLPLPALLAALPTGVERRNLRDRTKMVRHFGSIAAMAEHYGSLAGWLTGSGKPNSDLFGVDGWRRVRLQLELAYGNGRWASYKTAELLMKVNRWPLIAPDMGNEFSTGPRHGLELFFGPAKGNNEALIRRLDEEGLTLQRELVMRGVVVGIEQVETLLCDFHAMADGRYYPGHDLDQMQAQLRPGSPVWAARAEVFDARWLGEVGGWNGVDRERCKVYARTGRVLGR
jgi:hypothetical protein